MPLAPTFVSFSSTDIIQWRMMLAWKANEHIDFNFINCQLQREIRSEDESYIKSLCRQRINRASKFIQIIGEDARHKYKYVKWEADVAIEKGCTIIAVNLNGSNVKDDRCPSNLDNIGAIFVPFSPKKIKFAIEYYKMGADGNYYYPNKSL